MIQDIGIKINKLRTEKNMTLKDLAEKCNLSIPFISQIERGLASPAINTLNIIAEALDVELSYFFLLPKEKCSIITRSYDQVPFFVKDSGYVYNELSNYLEGRRMDAMLIIILPGEKSNFPDVNKHPGEEFVYVIEGIVTLLYDNKEYELFPGDSAHYSSEKPHTWVNATSKLVKILAVNTPTIIRDRKTV